MSLYRLMNCLNTSESQDHRGESVLSMAILWGNCKQGFIFLGQLEAYFIFFGWFCASPILKKLKPSEIDALTI